MIGEFLIFNIIILVIALIVNKTYNLNLFNKKNRKKLILVIILSFFIAETLAMLGYARQWWDIGHEVLVGISLPPIYLEDAFLYVIAPMIVIAVWERYLKFDKEHKKK
ncbi:MAG: hypothetical protein IB618_04115 [Candidatus Pacearchaeota archaeon]|nr:MAG: hypothetical protein IB618_04115 [Candidatus Pacearchaeota archaeon]